MKERKYVCMFEEKDGFMYQLYFKTKKKAKKFMKKQLKEYKEDTEYRKRTLNSDYSLPVIDARICKVIKTYVKREEI